jgi:hypothetical protein
LTGASDARTTKGTPLISIYLVVGVLAEAGPAPTAPNRQNLKMPDTTAYWNQAKL